MNYKKLLKNITKEEAESVIEVIHSIQEIDEKYKKSYFWSAGGNAATRRAREFDKEMEFTLNGNRFMYSCSYRESCKHCYFSKNVYFNEELITMRTINTLEEKLRKLIGGAE